MPSQQSSFRGTRTAFTPCHDAMAATEASSEGPSKMPRPWTHWYSVPERLTPWRWIVEPATLTRWLPETCTARTPGGSVGGETGGGVVAPEPVEDDPGCGPGLDVDLDPDVDLGAGVVEAGLGAAGVTTEWAGDGAPAEAEAPGAEELVAVAWAAASLPGVCDGHGESKDVAPHV